MGRQEKVKDQIMKIVNSPDQIRNMGVVAHIDHGKTTLSDSLLAAAGLINMDTAGQQLALDFHDDEQARGITINSANVSMVHTYEGKERLVEVLAPREHLPEHIPIGLLEPDVGRHPGDGAVGESPLGPARYVVEEGPRQVDDIHLEPVQEPLLRHG